MGAGEQSSAARHGWAQPWLQRCGRANRLPIVQHAMNEHGVEEECTKSLILRHWPWPWPWPWPSASAAGVVAPRSPSRLRRCIHTGCGCTACSGGMHDAHTDSPEESMHSCADVDMV